VYQSGFDRLTSPVLNSSYIQVRYPIPLRELRSLLPAPRLSSLVSPMVPAPLWLPPQRRLPLQPLLSSTGSPAPRPSLMRLPGPTRPSPPTTSSASSVTIFARFAPDQCCFGRRSRYGLLPVPDILEPRTVRHKVTVTFSNRVPRLPTCPGIFFLPLTLRSTSSFQELSPLLRARRHPTSGLVNVQVGYDTGYAGC